MNEIFVVGWSGGYEAASYVVKRTITDAVYEAFKEDADPERDEIDVIRINVDTLEAVRLYESDWAGIQKVIP